ncbi:MAG: YbgC/FadM family acyl-CoA thioesterase [Pseudomonadota bacterium]
MAVDFADTDAAGVVYHANYLSYMEKCRGDFLRARGVSSSWLASEYGVGCVVVKAEIDFRRPARLDDWLEIDLNVDDVKHTTAWCLQNVRKDDILLVEGRIKLATVSLQSGAPVRMPAELRNCFKDSYETLSKPD